MQATLSRNDANLQSVAVTAETRSIFDSLAQAITAERLTEEFPDVAEHDLYLQVCLHWHDLMEKGAFSTPPRDVVLDYGSRFASTENSRFHFELRKRLS